MAELTSVATIENEIYINGQYEIRQNCKNCGRSNGRTIPKISEFWNFDNLPNEKENLNSKSIQFRKFPKLEILKNSHFPKCYDWLISNIIKYSKLFNLKNKWIFKI